MMHAFHSADVDASASPPTPTLESKGLLREIVVLLSFTVLIGWLLALLSYSRQDPAWSTTGQAHETANWVGHLGALVADGSYFTLGFSVWWCVLVAMRAWLLSMIGGSSRSTAKRHPAWQRCIVFSTSLALLLCASTMLEWSRLYRFDELLPDHAGGMLGHMIGTLMVKWLGFNGSGVLGIVLMLIGIALVFEFSWARLAERVGYLIVTLPRTPRELGSALLDKIAGWRAVRDRKKKQSPANADSAQPADPVAAAQRPSAPPPPQPASSPQPMPTAQEALSTRPAMRASTPAALAKKENLPLFSGAPDTSLSQPQVHLLDVPEVQQDGADPQVLETTSRLIEAKLREFGVEVAVVAAMPGPVITRYEIELATGVKGAQIVNLAKDLARSLSRVSIRVVESVPGKTTMALELPNAQRQTIYLTEVLGSQAYRDAASFLTVGLGKDIVGKPVVADLGKMPHCLVAGTTGSGKSVGINAMILSLLFKADPRYVRLMMIDPKMLEMSVYEGIPHLLCPVVTDVKQAANGLNWCVAEMERRYKLLSRMGVRSLAGYNASIDAAHARGEYVPNPFSLTPDAPEPLARLPHIVVVIDELADLMMVVGKKIEELIARLAQKARAAGIHLILATQRPSVNVITGLIKANIPTRISFQVSSKIDSRTILDQMGAETLLGMGDMLYMPSGTSLPVRVHGAFVSDAEVHRVVTHLKLQGAPDYIEGVLEGTSDVESDAGAGSPSRLDDDGQPAGGDKDPMYDQAVEVVLKDRKASISYVQRKLHIGYNRSARILEMMERDGLVSPLTNSGQRDVLVPAPRDGDDDE